MGPELPHQSLDEKMESALAREYRIPFRTLLIAAGCVVLFVFMYSEVVKWVRDQVRLERATIDIRRDTETAGQDKLIAAHEVRIETLEAKYSQLVTSVAEVNGEVRAARSDIAGVRNLIEQHQRESKRSAR